MKRALSVNFLMILGLASVGVADVGNPKPANIKYIKVAVIDTGIDSTLIGKSWMCAKGHKDFSGLGLKDNHGHGTHVSGIIDQYAKNFLFSKLEPEQFKEIDNLTMHYCQIIIKYYDSRATGSDNLKNTIKAFKWAIAQKVDIINYSGGGVEADPRERAIIKVALNRGIKIVAAAGNERSDIDKHKYYPAMYDKRIYIVGNLVDSESREIASSSNYGKSINTWEVGTNVMSRMPNNLKFGFMTGTSQATAVKTGKLVREMLLSN